MQEVLVNERIIDNRIEEYREELRDIVNIVKELRGKHNGRQTSWMEPAEWHLKYSNINKKPELALTITLSPTGCEWAQQGGCTMCGEFEGSYKETILIKDPKFHIAQFAMAIGDPQIWAAAKAEKCDISWLRINQEGNFFNEAEMNRTAQYAILNLATHIRGLKKITVESRPQYLTEEVILNISKIFKDNGIKFEIGMGLEAKNEIIRNVCINKQEKNSDFVRAVSLLKQYGISPLAYIIIKPPFLTEAEAIDEAVVTAHFAHEIGFERISFEPMSIHPYTLVDALRQTGDYHAPWLWSVVEIAKRCADISDIVGIGGVGYYPIPSSYAHNYCNIEKDCDERFLNAIMEYNRTRDTSIFKNLSCECKSEWEKVCAYSSETLKDRIKTQINRVKCILPHYVAVEDDKAGNMRSIRIITGGSQL